MPSVPTSRARPLRRTSTHEREVLRGDARWLLAWIAVFAGTLGVAFGTYAIYRATGPHPKIHEIVRGLKHEARWLIPWVKGKPHAKNEF